MSREAFEKWAQERWYGTNMARQIWGDGDYKVAWLQAAWIAWQAASSRESEALLRRAMDAMDLILAVLDATRDACDELTDAEIDSMRGDLRPLLAAIRGHLEEGGR